MHIQKTSNQNPTNQNPTNQDTLSKHAPTLDARPTHSSQSRLLVPLLIAASCAVGCAGSKQHLSATGTSPEQNLISKTTVDYNDYGSYRTGTAVSYFFGQAEGQERLDPIYNTLRSSDLTNSQKAELFELAQTDSRYPQDTIIQLIEIKTQLSLDNLAFDQLLTRSQAYNTKDSLQFFLNLSETVPDFRALIEPQRTSERTQKTN